MAREFCRKGHPQTPENMRPGKKECAVCHRDRERERKRAKGAQPRGTRPDKRGHIPSEWPRRKGHSGCAECHRLDQLERYQADKESHRAKAREYARTHSAEALARHKAWRDANVDHVRQYGLKQMRARHVGRTAEGNQYVSILKDDPCSYCGGAAGHIDHIEPLARGGGNTWENLTATCKPCNSKKKSKPLLMFLLSVT